MSSLKLEAMPNEASSMEYEHRVEVQLKGSHFRKGELLQKNDCSMPGL